MPGNSKRNRENLVKTKLEYSDILELEEEKSLEEKDEDRSLVKRRDKKDDDDGDGDPKRILSSNNIK
jgi:hypothetical protein